jgi:MoaA/NifB/PqqE/SkfB family radical SAM enzyme
VITSSPIALRELWFHTGTACNLECPFCLEGSKPGDNRLERVTLADLKPYFDEAVELGVERFAFTGGEPLIVKDIVKILSYALQVKPCMIFTNGTAPLIKRVHQLQLLKAQPQPLSFQVSIDHPDEQRHDAGRGWGNFKRAMEGLKLLLASGFDVAIARHSEATENVSEVEKRYAELFRKHELPDLKLLPLPEFGRPGQTSEQNKEVSRGLAACVPHKTMCTESRMILKRDGKVRVYACALTDDDARFDLGTSLKTSLITAFPLQHHRCQSCLRLGATLSG